VKKIKENSKFAWVCDPIDGTMPYSNGLPIFTFSIALVDQETGLPVLGLVNDPIMKNMYWAYKGSGAFRNGEKIHILSHDDFKNSYMSIDGSRLQEFSGLKVNELLREKGVKLMKLLSFVYGAIQVANGKFVGSVFFGEYAHDVAALKIIVEEAGGKVTDLNGEERRYDEKGLGCIVSNGVLHNEIVDVLRKSRF
jgi:myo-inositol-1(or 4)-monophosphatase